MYAVLKIGTILCWAIAIGSEYVAQLWPQRKKLLNVFAAGCFGFALLGEYGSYRYDDLKQSQMEAAINAQGVPAIEWFQAKDTDEQTFTLSETPLSGSLEVLINGLIEPSSIYAVKGRAIAVSTKLDRSDQVIIKYRRKP
jgi:hypothetical protein